MIACVVIIAAVSAASSSLAFEQQIATLPHDRQAQLRERRREYLEARLAQARDTASFEPSRQNDLTMLAVGLMFGIASS